MSTFLMIKYSRLFALAMVALLFLLPACKPSTDSAKKDQIKKSEQKAHANTALSHELKARVDSDSIVATYILVRHAEKLADAADPHLTEQGKARASALATLLHEIPLDAVFSTRYYRTLQTAEPTAFDQGMEIKDYDPRDVKTIADRLKTDFYSHNVLIVGHSNTTPYVMNALLDMNIMSDIPEDEYHHILICFRHKDGSYEMIARDYKI